MSAGTESLFPDTRQYLADQVAKVEGLIGGMPEGKQEEYRSSSKPHRALREFDALVSHVENLHGFFVSGSTWATCLVAGTAGRCDTEPRQS